MIAGALEIQLLADVARIKADMDKATGIVASGARTMEKAAAGVKAALGGIVAGMTVAAFTHWIRGAIDAADAASKLSQKTGLAVKDIAGIELAYKLAGSSSEAMATSMARLSKGVVEQNIVLTALGIKTKTATGEFRGTKEVLLDVADQFKALPDGIQKTALAVELLGKSGAELIPLLNGGAEGIRQMDEMARKLGLTLDADTAKRAEEFNDTLDLIGMGSQGVARGIAAQLLPTLTNLASSFLESMTSGDRLARAADILGTALKGLYTVGVGIVELFSTVGKVLGGVGGGIGLILRGEFTLGANVIKEMIDDVGQGWKTTAAQIKTAWADEANASVVATAKVMGGQKDLLAAARAREEAAKKAAAAAQKEAEAYDKLVASLNGKEAGVDPDFLEKLKLIVSQGKLRNVSAAETVRLQELLIRQQPYMVAQAKEALDLAKERQKLRQQESDQIEDYMRAESARLTQTVTATRDALQSARDELANRGKLKSEIEETTIARLEEQLVTKTAGTEAYKALEDQIKLRKELRGVLKDIEVAEANDKAAEAAKQQWQQVSDAFVDNLMRGGKSVAQYLKDLFRTLVLRPLLAPIGGAIAGLVGALPTAANAAGTGMLGSLGSSMLGNSVMGGASLFGAGLNAGIGSIFGEAGIMGGLDAGFTALGAGNLAGGLGTIAGVAAPFLLGALALSSLFGSKGGPKSEGGFAPGGMSIAGLDIGGNMQGSQRGDVGAAQQISQGISASYAALAQQLGLVNQKLDVGIFYATDPQGDSMTQLQVVTGSYNRSNRLGGIENVARGEDALKAAITEETTRVIFEALKASDLADQYKQWLNAVAADAGVDEMTAAIERVTKAKSERDRLDAMIFDLTATDLEKLSKQRDAERAAVDESNRAILEHVYALQDEKAAAEKAAEVMRIDIPSSILQMSKKVSTAVNTVGVDFARLSAQIASNTLQSAVERAQKAYADAMSTQHAELQQTISSLTSFANGLKDLREQLDGGPQGGLFGDVKYAQARQALSGANAGNAQELVKRFLDAASEQAGSSLEYRRDVAYAKSILESLESSARNQITSIQGSINASDAAAALAASAKLQLAQLNQRTYGMDQAEAGPLYDDLMQSLFGQSGMAKEAFEQWASEVLNVSVTLPSYAVGTPWVPRDGMAYLHEGEAVLTRAENRARRGEDSTANDTPDSRLSAIEEETRQVRQTLDAIVNGSLSLLTRTTA